MARVCVTLLDGKQKRTERYAATREQALQELEAMRTIVRQRSVSVGRMTLREFLQNWMEAIELAPATRQSYRLSIDNYIIPDLGHYYLSQLTAFEVSRWMASLKERTVERKGKSTKIGARTRQIALSVLRAAAKGAIEMGATGYDFTAGVRRPSMPRPTIIPFTVEEVQRILASVRNDRLYALFVMSFFCGLRQGELFALQWKDINWDDKTISVTRQRSEVAGVIHEREPKTTAGKRTIGLSEICLDALHERRQLAVREKQAANPWVFIGERGKPLRRSNFGNRMWKPLLKTLGLAHRGLHHARHTTATLALKAQTPVHLVSSMLGHTLASTTIDLYGHAQTGDHEITAEAVAKAIRGQSGVKTG
ncbi:Putative prophage phiRv2 integrase [Planctomyces sp. SH-PL14]|nr:Putative prophage phiRv2 integrase [Planctomyces sp. SH-PL14]